MRAFRTWGISCTSHTTWTSSLPSVEVNWRTSPALLWLPTPSPKSLRLPRLPWQPDQCEIDDDIAWYKQSLIFWQAAQRQFILHSRFINLTEYQTIYQNNSISQLCMCFQVYDQYLNFITLEDDMFVLCHQNKELISYQGNPHKGLWVDGWLNGYIHPFVFSTYVNTTEEVTGP